MKIAVVAAASVSGGAEEYLCKLYRGLSSKFGVEATLIGSIPGWSEDAGRMRPTRSSVKLTRRKGIAIQGVKSVAAAIELLHTTRGEYDAFHLQYLHPKLLISGSLAKRAPMVWTEHGPLPPTLPRVARKMLSAQGKKASVVAVSSVVAESLLDEGIKSTVIHNPLPIKFLSEQSPRRVDGPIRTVLFAGRLHQAKRVDLLLEAARLLPDLRFLIAGTGPAEAGLKNMATSNVEFLGHRSDILPILRSADCVVVTSGRSAREGNPMIMLEARALGMPVFMASDCHAANEATLLGCYVFDPSPRALASSLSKTNITRFEPLDADLIASRSEHAWLEAHYRLLSATCGEG